MSHRNIGARSHGSHRSREEPLGARTVETTEATKPQGARTKKNAKKKKTSIYIISVAALLPCSPVNKKHHGKPWEVTIKILLHYISKGTIKSWPLMFYSFLISCATTSSMILWCSSVPPSSKYVCPKFRGPHHLLELTIFFQSAIEALSPNNSTKTTPIPSSKVDPRSATDSSNTRNMFFLGLYFSRSTVRPLKITRLINLATVCDFMSQSLMMWNIDPNTVCTCLSRGRASQLFQVLKPKRRRAAIPQSLYRFHTRPPRKTSLTKSRVQARFHGNILIQ